MCAEALHRLLCLSVCWAFFAGVLTYLDHPKHHHYRQDLLLPRIGWSHPHVAARARACRQVCHLSKRRLIPPGLLSHLHQYLRRWLFFASQAKHSHRISTKLSRTFLLLDVVVRTAQPASVSLVRVDLDYGLRGIGGLVALDS